MMNLTWERNKDGVISTLSTYFGLTNEQVVKLINENFLPNPRVHIDYVNRNRGDDREKLVAVVGALVSACKDGKPAYIDGVAQPNIDDRMKSGEAILTNPKFSDDERPIDIYHRLKRLYKSISDKGIDIYKTIYVTSITDGNYGIIHDRETGTVSTYSNFDKDFDNIYNQLRTVLRLSQEDANTLVEKCSATILSKVSASNIPAMYQEMMLLTLKNEEERKLHYFFRRDKEYEGKERRFSKSKMIDEGLINCPTIFSCKPEKVADAFSYVESKIPEDLIEKEYMRFRSVGNTTMTRFWCKHQIMRNWINNNFSLLTINAGNMRWRESILHEVAISLNDRVYRGGKDSYYNFSFLFNKPVSISTMNAIPVEKLERNARRNILTLEKYTDEKGVVDYIERNHYVLAMDNDKLETLLKVISAHDAVNPDNPCMERFFMIGKSLFGSKHCINFDVERTVDRLRQIEKIQILDVERMDDWERLSTYTELFLGNDQTFVNQVQRLYHEKLQKEKRGSGALRKQIRTLLIKNGGWDAILKDTRRMKEVTSEVKCIHDQRFAVEQIEKTENTYADIAALQAKEDTFADAIKGVLARVRNSYTANKDKLNKRFTDIDKLYEYTIEFLTERCFDDKEPISVLIEEELRSPYVDALKNMDSTYINPQQSLFNSETVEVTAPKGVYAPLKKLTDELSFDTCYKVDTAVVNVSRAKDEGK